MSRAGVPRTVAALAVLAAATSLVSCNFNKDSVALVETLAPDVNTVHIDFSCGATTSIGLTDGSGNSAWAVVRHPNNSIQLLDKIVSKEHCILEQREGGFVLRDLGSLTAPR